MPRTDFHEAIQGTRDEDNSLGSDRMRRCDRGQERPRISESAKHRLDRIIFGLGGSCLL